MYKIIEIKGKPHLFKQGSVSVGRSLVKKRYVEHKGVLVAPKFGKTGRNGGFGPRLIQYFYRGWNVISFGDLWSDIGVIKDQGGHKVGEVVARERDIVIAKGIITLRPSSK